MQCTIEFFLYFFSVVKKFRIQYNFIFDFSINDEFLFNISIKYHRKYTLIFSNNFFSISESNFYEKIVATTNQHDAHQTTIAAGLNLKVLSRCWPRYRNRCPIVCVCMRPCVSITYRYMCARYERSQQRQLAWLLIVCAFEDGTEKPVCVYIVYACMAHVSVRMCMHEYARARRRHPNAMQAVARVRSQLF